MAPGTSWFAPRTNKRRRTTSSSAYDAEKKRTMSNDFAEPMGPLLGQPEPPPRTRRGAWRCPRLPRTRNLALVLAVTVLAVYLLWGDRIATRPVQHAPPPPDAPLEWERFPLLKRYYGGVLSVVPKRENTPEFPRPGDDVESLQEILADGDADDGSTAQLPKGKMPAGVRFDPYEPLGINTIYEERVPCFLNASNKAEIPQLLVYPGVPRGFAEPAYGSHDLFGLRNDICFDRFGRYGPYGYGYSRSSGGLGAGINGHRDGAQEVWGGSLEVDYSKVKWADAQQRCIEANAHRFRAPTGDEAINSPTGMGSGRAPESATETAEKTTGPNGKRLVPRTAVVIRTWRDFHYDEEDILYLRAIINELALQSGGQYVVHFLIHVKNNDLQLWSDEETYQQVLDSALPAEFHGMGTLWTERQMELIYGGVPQTVFRDLPVFGVYRSTNMPLQYFAHRHPEYDFFWHWEMDIRYTGHFHHLFDKISQWAKQQPRKELWERNGRFYVPGHHGSWQEFSKMVHNQTAVPSKQDLDTQAPSDLPRPIWGPLRPTGKGDKTARPEQDPIAPHDQFHDNYDWGVGEEADLITFNPLFDPDGTNWILAEDVTGYNTTETFPPRRTAIITAARLSRRLLETMHRETSLERHTMFSEMWPASVALQHGLKAVYAPHPVYMDRRWPLGYLTGIFNNGVNGATGGRLQAVFSDENQHNFYPSTWYYHARFAEKLWKRWLGVKVDGVGGKEWELDPSPDGLEIDHSPHAHPAAPDSSLPESFAQYRGRAIQHGPLAGQQQQQQKSTSKSGSSGSSSASAAVAPYGAIGGHSGKQLGSVQPAHGEFWDREELPARFRRRVWSEDEIEAVDSAGARTTVTMYEYILHSQIPAAQHDLVLNILAGVTAMQPAPFYERNIIYQQLRSEEGQTQQRLRYHRLQTTPDTHQHKLLIEETPDAGIKDVAARKVSERLLVADELPKFRSGSQVYSYVGQYVLKGYRFVQGHVGIRVFRVYEVTVAGDGEVVDAPTPSKDELNLIDKSGAYIIEANIRTEDNVSQESRDAAKEKLLQLAKSLEGSAIDLRPADRLALSTNVKSV
ncbi:hypothetical protein BDY17DRAFT_348515 [Neohortaea acidophila]|uniref:Uncharacterized protein n=1 Tax=Neohortaea acidophila TaxID=245834 RepID=A0A6A6PJN0_9PEZI|nr:uncharacterized protein BDY17DRAFT_348515 [Neohortaea acidophila]KAF2479894.1 hypothetical protein BDY17DRAFT_348515 [Neohortaea acidophila]